MNARLALAVLAPLASILPTPTARAQENGGPSGHQKMLKALKEILDRTDEETWLLGGVKVRDLRQKLEALKPEAPAAVRFQLLVDLGDALVYYGDEREGLGYFEQAFKLDAQGIPNGPYQDSKIRYAAAWLRLAETENCCA